MTMLSFRIEESEAAAAQQWAERLGVERSELLRDAVHRYLVQLQSEHDAEVWERAPRSEAERALDDIAGWGPAEDWSDWVNAAG